MKTRYDKPSLLSECDKCVMCGLCLPYCPTYTRTLDENESPRGRVSLARALLRGDLENNALSTRHLDHCLLCRACERMCPSGVQFGQIIDGVRAVLAATPHDLPLPVTDTKKLARLNHRLWWYQKTGMQKLVRTLRLLGKGELARKDGLLPELVRQQPWKTFYPAAKKKAGQVQLFTGCISNSFDHKTLRDALRVLNQFGYDVHVPATQACCGALAQHRGDTGNAGALARANTSAFAHGSGTVISLHSGCSASLRETLDHEVMDICDLVIREHITPGFRPLEKKVVVHTPCTQRNVLRTAGNVSRVLAMIPGIEIIELPAALSCCGSAGSYMLDYPEDADAIRQPTIEAIHDSKADILVTSNIGCAMHLQAGLRETGISMQVIHPVALIAAQLPDWQPGQ